MIHTITRRIFPAVLAFAAATASWAAQPSVTIEKPKPRTTNGGACRVVSNATLSGIWGPSSLPTLAFTIGPGSAMADMMHADKRKFTGPGSYPNVIIAVYLGKTATEDVYAGLGTVTLNSDNTGTFALNDHSASGHFDCGGAPRKD